MRRSIGIATAVLLLGIVGTASADFSFELGVEFSGADSPEGTPPWITAMFADQGNDVLLTMSATNLVDHETIGKWFFNYTGADPTRLDFDYVSGTGPTGGDTAFSTRTPGVFHPDFKADGDGFFDILFDFPPQPGYGPEWFQAGESVIWKISHLDGDDLDPAMFWDTSLSGDGSDYGLFTAAHIQGIGFDDEGSGWITIPAPGAALLGAIGLGTIVWLRRRLS